MISIVLGGSGTITLSFFSATVGTTVKTSGNTCLFFVSEELSVILCKCPISHVVVD